MNKFDAYEIAPVIESDDGSCEPFLSLAAAEEADALYCEATCHSESTRIIWTLYGHHPEGGVSAIGDFSTYEDAAEIYSLITGCEAPENEAQQLLTALPVAPGVDNYALPPGLRITEV